MKYPDFIQYYFFGMSGLIITKSRFVAAFRRNQWPDCIGTGGRFGSEWVAGLTRILQIVSNKDYPEGKAIFFKCPHHGSISGHNEKVWETLLVKNPITCLTPFKLGSVLLPSEDDISRIYKYTDKAYSTSSINRNVHIKRTGAIKKTLDDVVKSIKPVFSTNGHIRIRFKPSVDIFPRIDLFNDAVELNKIYV